MSNINTLALSIINEGVPCAIRVSVQLNILELIQTGKVIRRA